MMTTDGIIGIYSNVNSLSNKREEIIDLINEISPGILLFTETWLTDEITDKEIEINGYELFRKDRKVKRGGGLITYIKNDFRIVDLSNEISPNIEAMWFEVGIYENNFLFGLFYRPPNSNHDLNSNIIDCLKRGLIYYNTHKLSDLFIIGDFNAPDINWEFEKYDYTKNLFKNEFLDFIHNHSFTQHVMQDTRHRGNSSSLLDLVLSLNSNYIRNIEYGPPLGKSDHLTMKIIYNISSHKCNDIYHVIDFKNSKYDLINEELENINVDQLFNQKLNVQKDFEESYEKILQIVRRYTNIKTFNNEKKKKFKQNWINKDILYEIKKRNRLYKIYLKTKKIESLEIYKKQRNKLNFIRTRARKKYEYDLIITHKNNKSLFQHLKKKNSRAVVDHIMHEGKMIKDKNLIANIFNNHYARIDILSNWEIPNDIYDDLERNIPFTNKEEVLTIIDKVKDSQATSEDIIPFFILKRCKLFFSVYIAKLINISMITSYIPDIWKISHIWPKFKSGDKYNINSYRPISFVSAIAKIAEKIILIRINVHLDQKKILQDTQHGFRENFSTLTNLLHFNDFIIEGFEDSKPTDIIFLDLTAAFDSVDQKHLIKKLIQMEFPRYITSWVSNFILQRSVRTNFNGSISGLVKIKSGVPQGAVLSATLFNIYLADIPNLTSKIIIYADDIKILRNIKNNDDTTELQRDLNKLDFWCKANYLKINPLKSEVLHLGKNNKKHIYILNDSKIKSINFHKDLGVIFDSNFDFSHHASYISKRLKQMFGQIKSNIKFISPIMFEILYKTYLQYLYSG